MYHTKQKRGLSLFLLVLVSLSLMVSCANESENKKTADLVYVNWAEGVAYTHLAKLVLEEKMGYEVDITTADVAPAYASVAQGDQDAFMESWLPVIQKQYVEKYKDRIVDLGHVFENTEMGLVVPSYVDIDNISELNEHADKFGNKIVGIDAGAGVMVTTDEDLIPSYSIDLELMPSSGPAMTAALKEAIANEEWIVVTGWTPHWMFGRWDLKFLKQDQEKIWGNGNIHIFGRKHLREEKPELAAFLSNMILSQEELSDLMLKVRTSDDSVTEVARQWMTDHPKVIESWIPQLQ